MQQTRGNLLTAKQQMRFDGSSRRFRNITNAQVGNYATQQEKVWATGTHKASAKLAMEDISMKPTDVEAVGNGTSNLISAYVKLAEMDGAQPGDPMYEEAVQRGKRDAFAVQLDAIAVEDPARAMRMLEKNKATAGTLYDNLSSRFRARADQQVGQETADRIIGGGTSLKAGDDTLGVIRHFEGFRSAAYEDKSPGAKTEWRVGYGSDTVTHADGTYSKVTKDTVVTKEDAERDLARRAGLSQQDARKAIGQEAWDKLDARAKASLTSIAYNYGTLSKPELATVREAAKAGDTEKLAAAITALGTHNGGINARRRAIEGANVKGQVGPEGRDSLPDQASVMNAIENDPSLTPQAKASAIAQANRTYQASRTAQIATKTAFDSQVKDSTAEAMMTGATTSPIPESSFVQQYGPTTGPVKYQEYVNEVQFGADRHSFETMSEQDIRRVVEARMPKPGEGGVYAPGYANQVEKVQRLQKEADRITKQRYEDPAGAVDRMPAVQAAWKLYDPKQPETFAAVAAARKNAQDILGIDPEYQAVITKAEGLKLTEPLMRAPPSPIEQKKALEEMGQNFRKMFGDDAPAAMAYALRARKVSVETAQVAGRIISKMAIGEGISEIDARELDFARDVDAAQKAAWGPTGTGGDRNVVDRGPNFAGRQRAQPRVIGNPENDTGVEGSPVINITPPGRAVQALLANPERLSAFREEYGDKAAEDVVKKFPVIFKKEGRGG